MALRVRRFAAVFAVVSLAAGGAALAEACGSSNPVALPGGPDGSTQNEEASADAPVAETGVDTSTDGPVVNDGGAGDAGDAAHDAPPGDAPSDAPMMVVDAQALCASLCDAGTCTNGTCGIDCSASNACAGAVTCPPGIPCTVTCGNNGCAAGVDCTQATTCDITCSGAHSCAGKLHCGGQSCTIDCSGAQSCAGGACCDAGSCMLTGITSMCP